MKTFATAVLVLVAVLVVHQQAIAADRKLVPSASSPTAMVKCGAQLEPVKARLGALQRYVFTGKEVLREMRYCISESSTDVVDTRNQYRVPKGTVGWLAPDGWVVLEGCVNDALCEGCATGSAATLLQDTVAAPPVLPAPAAPAPPVPTVAGCPDGWRLIANVWSYSSLSPALQKEAKELMAAAERRDSSSVEAYKPDDVSRKLGGRLRSEVQTRAPISLDLPIVERDPKMGKVMREIGTLRVEAGTGSVVLSDDPRKQGIVETVWSRDFHSPAQAGDGKRRLWLFPTEWGAWCSMNVHGIVP